MRLSRRSTLPVVARTVGQALTRHGVNAVLTGGACASFYTRGTYTSRDVDFVVIGLTTGRALDEAMATIGFRREADRYVHPAVRFYVEFPRGPLAIGEDLKIRPRRYETSSGVLRALSPTDSCRDRLAAFYHWGDRQSLKVAVAIALRNPVSLAAVRRWSRDEGKVAAFEEFVNELRKARTRRKETA